MVYTTMRAVTAAARRAQVVIHPGAGHFLPAESPAEVAAGIRQLVEDSRAARA